MVSAKPRRGRPIGTGIDDSDRIARLAELLKSQPHLKPTTALRAMGFSDPSTIRRLRDKFKALQKSEFGVHLPKPAGAHLPVSTGEALLVAAASQQIR